MFPSDKTVHTVTGSPPMLIKLARLLQYIWEPQCRFQPGAKMGGIAMLENINKLVDVIEDLLAHVDSADPIKSDQLVELGARLGTIAMEIRDRTDIVE